MLPRRLRLTRHSFPARGSGVRVFSQSFTLVSGPSKAGGCAVVVSKAVARRASARNLLRRRILSLLQPVCRSDRFLVLYARGSAATLTHQALTEELTGLLARIKR